MKIALHGINMGVCADPHVALRVAKAAEDAGFESLWTAEHVVLPDPHVPPSPVPPQTAFLDPAVSLAYLAAHTRTIRLATGIIILPQRNPLVLAKELASVDVVSGGRLIFGIGVGYLEPEFDALGIPFEDKGRRTDEYLEAILTLWTETHPRYAGRFVAFDHIDAQPRPVQKPHPPIVVGGHSPAAHRRAVSRGNGWYGFFCDLDNTREHLAGLARAAHQVERPAALGKLEITVTPPPGIGRDAIARYAELGVDRLALMGMTSDEEELVRYIEEVGN